MRPIDADELISILEWNKGREKDKLVSINSLIKLVRARPTAYDVDKVVEQLEDKKKICLENYECLSAQILRQAIVIVKAGGVE